MTVILWNLLDLVLALLVIGLASATLSSRDPRRGIALFIAFGLLLAVIWARLNAPDVALAEAAIGAGLSGALLLAALRDESTSSAAKEPAAGAAARVVDLACLVLAGLLGWALVYAVTGAEPLRLANDVADALADSGVANPVTAVLLNFRAYDTLLELAVLAAAVLGILAVGVARPQYRPASVLLGGMIGWLVPLFILAAGYLLWVGAHAPGGAFQAGALLAGAAVLLRLGGDAAAGLPGERATRWLLVAGVGVFTITGLAVTAGERGFLQYPREWAGVLILLIETAAVLSIAATLALAYVGGIPPAWQHPDSNGVDSRRRKAS